MVGWADLAGCRRLVGCRLLPARPLPRHPAPVNALALLLVSQFFRIGRAPTFTAGDPFQPDARLRLAVGAKASAVGGKAPTTDDTAFTVSAKKKFVVNKQQEVVRNRVLLRSYTQAVAAANYDYNLRTERVGGVRVGGEGMAEPQVQEWVGWWVPGSNGRQGFSL